MNREEFLRILRGELLNNVSPSKIEEQINFYATYINDEKRKGRAEEEIISELGQPSLIARSIIDAAEAAGDRVTNTSPFRFTEAEINFNSDEEDLAYTGASEDSDSARNPFQRFHQRSEKESDYQERETSYDGQTVERGRKEQEPNEFPFMGGTRPRVYQFGTMGCLVTLIILCVILYLLMWFVGNVFSLLSPILIPALLALLIAQILYRLFN